MSFFWWFLTALKIKSYSLPWPLKPYISCPLPVSLTFSYYPLPGFLPTSLPGALTMLREPLRSSLLQSVCTRCPRIWNSLSQPFMWRTHSHLSGVNRKVTFQEGLPWAPYLKLSSTSFSIWNVISFTACFIICHLMFCLCTGLLSNFPPKNGNLRRGRNMPISSSPVVPVSRKVPGIQEAFNKHFWMNEWVSESHTPLYVCPTHKRARPVPHMSPAFLCPPTSAHTIPSVWISSYQPHSSFKLLKPGSRATFKPNVWNLPSLAILRILECQFSEVIIQNPICCFSCPECWRGPQS